MMVLTSPSTDIRGDPVCARPHLEYQEAPGKVAKDADGAREAIARAVVHEVILHCRPQTQRFCPSAPSEDDSFGKIAECRLLIQPRTGHAAAKLRASHSLFW